MGFADSVRLTAEKMQKQVNNKALDISAELFTKIVKLTPVGDSKTKGQLINNWHVGIGKGNINKSQTSSFNTSGANSLTEITKLANSNAFLKKDGEVSFTNTVHYGYRAEYFGWNTSKVEPQWRGTKPYGMVRNALTYVAGNHRK